MTLDISKYPEPNDYGEVLLRLMAPRIATPRLPFPAQRPFPALSLVMSWSLLARPSQTYPVLFTLENG
ncbi:MAG: hypothetical protein CMK06_12965 [Ponticaulis sp.]|nr:hypothetical protein [Ponticaulis sp.]